MPRTGFVGADVQDDFLRARRRRAAALIMRRLRARARRRQRHPPLRGGDRRPRPHRRAPARAAGHPARLDRRHRGPHARVRPPVPAHLRPGARALGADRRRQRRGESMPPIDVYRIGELHFVRDGHHRVSVARALGRADIDAYVTEVQHPGRRRARGCAPPTCPARATSGCSTSASRSRRDARERIRLSDPLRLRRAGGGRGGLGLPRHAGPRRLHGPREVAADAGTTHEYCRWSRCCARPDLLGPGTETDAYLRVAASATACSAPTSGATRRSRRSAR